MEITRVFSPDHLEVGGAFRLSEEEAHHVRKVLRGRPGDTLEVVDGARRLFAAELLDGWEAAVLEEKHADASRAAEEREVVLYQAVPKGRHMDLVVEKATELGVSRVVPLVTEHGVVRTEHLGDGKVGRWRRVAEAAARQSLRLRVPEVVEAMGFAEAAREAGGEGVLLHNGRELPPLEDVVPEGGAVSLFVGPEGGFSEGELETGVGAGLRLASLGPFRLRSETAGVVAVARACAVLRRAGSTTEALEGGG